ncbi:MAG: C4-dicarboxylate ABC transporter substrate-binding protein [Pseudomonadota bacterium]|nr:C4-dicarboxylate ABC transporter substrate-binding protein [Pseudomonadota bacterium]
MPRPMRLILLSIRDLLVSFGPFAVLAVALLALAYYALDPMPPKRLRLATGPEQSAYEAIGADYRDRLARFGVTVELVPTAGSSDNFERLAAAGEGQARVDFGFVQGGTAGPGQARESGVVSLGSLFYEPVWLFYRDGAPGLADGGTLDSLAGLAGWRVATGPPGTGVPVLFGRLLEANRIDPGTIERLSLEHTPAVVELLAGGIDAVVFASAPESPLVRMLLQTPGVRLLDFAQADAYERRFGFLSKVLLPRGVVDLGADVPPVDHRLVATTTTLVARGDTHPALVQLMVQAAAALHGEPSWFSRAGTFPAPGNMEVPLADEAARFYRDGRPLLQRYLPFWLANLVDRMWVVLAAIVAVLIPLSRLVPPLYQFRVRSRVFRWYAQLRAIEEDVGEFVAAGAGRPSEAARLVGRLDELDARVERIAVPLSHAEELYALRSHIALVRRRLAPDAGTGAQGDMS